MNREFLQELRQKLAIPLTDALILMKQAGEDFAVCERLWHEQQIQKICQATDCSLTEAKNAYQNYPTLEKAIHAIKQQQQSLFLTMDHQAVLEPYGFVIWCEQHNKPINEPLPCDVYIPFDHFVCVLADFQSVYLSKSNPLKNATSFDPYGDNRFSQMAVQQLIQKLKHTAHLDCHQKKFCQTLGDWLALRVEMMDCLVVRGTL